MKIVVTGKGGVGKTTIAGTMARQMARLGHSVVALDCDPSPNLGIPLGLSPDQLSSVKPVFNELVERGHTHNDPQPDAEELLASLHTKAADGVMLLATGEVVRRADSCMCCGSHSSSRDMFKNLHDRDRLIMADLEAGLNDLIWTSPAAGDVLVAVAEPTVKSIDIAARACRLGTALGVTRMIGVANRCVDPQDFEAVAEKLACTVCAVPEDPALARADEEGMAPLDFDASSPAMVAIAGLVDRVLALDQVPSGGLN